MDERLKNLENWLSREQQNIISLKNETQANIKRIDEVQKSYANLLCKKVELKEKLEILEKDLYFNVSAILDRISSLERKNKAQIEVNKQLLPRVEFSIWDLFKRK